MKVLQLTLGRKYSVWAMCDEDGVCDVLEMLERVKREHPDLVETMTALLFEIVPNDGPPLDDPRRAKMLYRDKLFELKADKDLPRRKHIGLRVVYFYDNSFYDGSVIVCSNAFCKSRGTPEECLDLAKREYSRYFENKDDLELIV